MRKFAVTGFCIVAFALTVSAQKPSKPWTEWSKKDAEKILNDSPWGHTRTESDTSEMFYSPTGQGRDPSQRRTQTSTSGMSQDVAGINSNRSVSGATNQAVNLNFRIRFFTAKPIRQAFIRLMQLQNPNLDDAKKKAMINFTETHTDDWIIVAFDFDSNDQRYSGPVFQMLGSATTDTLKNNTYLERKDGKRVDLSEYLAPGNDGFGARLVFPRKVDGQPFLTPESGEVRFFIQTTGSNPVKLSMPFKVADMIYDGKLEY